MSDNSKNALIARPIGKVEITVGQIGSFIPNDPSQDYHASHFYNSLDGSSMKYLQYNKEMEAIHRPILDVRRDNYIFYGDDEGDCFGLPLYPDSNLLVESYRRTWEAIPLPHQLNKANQSNANKKFIAPQRRIGYPQEYGGPQWSTQNYTDPQINISYLLKKNKSLIGNCDIGLVKWIKQDRTGSFAWAIRQVESNFTNQSFTVYCKKAKALDPSRSQEGLSFFDGYAGSYFSIFIGGGFEYLKPNYGEEYSTINPEDYYRFAFIFPIGAAPYVIWTKAWATNYYLGDDPRANSATLPPFLERYIVEKNNDDGWILSDSESEFSITFNSFQGKIFITSSFAENPWVFPSVDGSLYKSMLKIITGKNLSPQEDIPPYLVEIPDVPIEIHGRGFCCAINMTPTEYKFPEDEQEDQNANGTTAMTKDKDKMGNIAHINLPNLVYSPGISGNDGQILAPWGYNYTSSANNKTIMYGPDVFRLPGKNEMNKAFPKYGFDYNPATKLTTHSLPGNCLSVNLIEDYLATEAPPDIIQIPGNNVALTRSNALSKYTRFRKYCIVFNDVKPVLTRIGSKHYTTPFFFRIKFKGRVKRVAPKESDWIDVSNHVVEISHDAKHEDGVIINKNVSITFMLPKKSDAHKNDFAIQDKEFWAKLGRKHFLVRVFLGLDPNNSNVPEKLKYDPTTPYFTGVAWGGDISYSAKRDQISIHAIDLTEVLKDTIVMNSPHYDGMDLRYGIATALERAGFSALTGLETGDYSDSDVVNFTISDRALALSDQWVLPDSLNFTQPLLKFSPGTKVFDIIKSFVQRFWLVFKATREGGFQLDSWPGATSQNTYANVDDPNAGVTNHVKYKPTNLLTPGTTNEFNAESKYYIYRSIPQKNNGGFEVSSDNNYLYFVIDGRNKKIIKLKPSKWNNFFGISTVDRFTGGIDILSQGDPGSIADPNSPNFIGFMKAGWQQQAGYGGKIYARQALSLIFGILSQPIMLISIQVWGNRLLEPLDIIKVDSNNFRIQSINGTVAGLDSRPEWIMNISGENFSTGTMNGISGGEWITAEDINIEE